MGRENPIGASHPLSKSFRDLGGSRANVDENEANEPLSSSISASGRRSSSQLGHSGRLRREQGALPDEHSQRPVSLKVAIPLSTQPSALCWGHEDLRTHFLPQKLRAQAASKEERQRGGGSEGVLGFGRVAFWRR